MTRTHRGCLAARRGRRRALWWAGLTAAPLAATLVLPSLVSAWWLRHERRAWTRDDPRGADLLDREQPMGANETARRLAAIVRPLGIELDVFRSSDPELAPALAFVDAERHADGDAVPPAAAAVRVLLDRSAEALAAAEGLLASSQPPAWPHDWRRLFDASPPPVLGLRALNALLLARASDRARAGDRAGAERALLASRRLGESVEERPETLAQIAAAALAGERAGVLRRLTDPSPEWAARMGARDYRGPFLSSYQAEARLGSEYARGRSFSWREVWGGAADVRPAVPLRALDRLLTTPYVRFCAADSSRWLRHLAAELRRSEPCRVDTETLEAAVTPGRWNAPGRIALSSAAHRISLVRDLELEEELTRVVLETRAQRPQRADAVASRVCGGLDWTRTPDQAGGITVGPSGVRLPDRAGRSPWSYRLAPPPTER